MMNFIQTGYGKTLFGGQIPALIKAQERQAVAAEKIAEALSKNYEWKIFTQGNFEKALEDGWEPTEVFYTTLDTACVFFKREVKQEGEV